MATTLVPLGNPGTVAVPGGDDDASSKFQPVSKLNVEHPIYQANKEAWGQLALLREGGVAIKKHSDKLLRQRPREDTDVFAARCEQFTYQNILGTALGWYGAALFECDPTIYFKNKKGDNLGKKEARFYVDFLGNCDGNKKTYVDFFKRVFSTMLTYGGAYVLTDLRTLAEGEEPPATMAEQLSRGLLDPTLTLLTPMEIINWECDESGEVLWVVVKITQEKQAFLGEKTFVDTWYYYNRTDYEVYRDVRKSADVSVNIDGGGRKAERIRQGRHSLAHQNRVPVRKIELTEGLWLANKAYLLLLDHLNQDNTLSWSLFMSNLAIPVIIGDVDASNMTASEVGYLQFPAGTTYTWSEADGKSFEHSAKRIESLREEAYRSMFLQSQGRSMRATPAMQSGRSKELEMAPAKDIKSSMGSDVRRSMQEVLVDVVDARQDTTVVPDVSGFNFEEDMSTEEVFAVSSILGLRIPSEKFERYIYKKVAKHCMPDANRDQLEAVYTQIDAGPTMEDRMKQDLDKQIELAKAGMSAALKKTPGSGGPTPPPGRGGAGPSPKAR